MLMMLGHSARERRSNDNSVPRLFHRAGMGEREAGRYCAITEGYLYLLNA